MTKSEIQLIRSLSDARARREAGLFIAEGEKLIGEIIDSHLVIRKIYATAGIYDAHPQTEVLSRKEMERISHLKSAANSLALVEIPHYDLEVGTLAGELTIALDEVQNPGNMGTIIRLADWYGVRNIICSPSSADCYNPKVVQATMGAILRVKVHYASLPEVLNSARALDIPILGTTLDGEDIYHGELPNNAIIVMGNEGRGISNDVAKHLTSKVFIPPYPASRNGSESLNVAIATAVICAEIRRRG